MTAVGYTGGDPTKVDVAGDTMTGPLVLPGDPSSGLEAATKDYVDTHGGGGGGGTPSNTVVTETTYGQSSAAGVATAYSRGDHTHGSPALGSTGSTAAAGNHNHSGVYDASGAAATALASALAADVPLGSGTPSAITIAGSGAAGASTSSSHQDHSHAGPGFGNVVVETSFGQASGNGSAATVARSDHTHGTPTAPTVPSASSSVAAETSFGISSAVGVAATFSRGDHTHGTMATPTATTVGLGNVDNTNDAGKPVSTAQQTALNLKANLAGPTFTGTPSGPTAVQGTNTTQFATTQYVQTEVGLLVPKGLVDAKGDLFVGTADNTVARQAVGADGLFLMADSTKTNGITWAAPVVTGGGGGGTDFKVGAIPRTGQWYRGNFGPVGSNLTLVLNRLYFSVFRLGADTTFDRIGIDVAIAAAATGVGRLGIWASDAAGGLPGTLILDAGTVVTDSTGAKQATISQLLAKGVYWLGLVGQTVITGCAIRGLTSYDPLIPYFSGASMFTGSTAPGGIFANGVSGALASNPTIVDNDNGPIIGLRAA